VVATEDKKCVTEAASFGSLTTYLMIYPLSEAGPLLML
jgi:hypothetical protein